MEVVVEVAKRADLWGARDSRVQLKHEDLHLSNDFQLFVH
jgi:hypothetical protein